MIALGFITAALALFSLARLGRIAFEGLVAFDGRAVFVGSPWVMGFNTGDAALRANRLLTLQKDLFVADGFDPTPTSRVARRAAMAKGPRKVDLLRTLSAERPPVPSLSSVTGIAVKGDVASSLVRLANRIGLTGVIRGCSVRSRSARPGPTLTFATTSVPCTPR